MARGGVPWHYVAPAAMIGMMFLLRGVVLPAFSVGLHDAGVKHMERSLGTKVDMPVTRRAEPAKPPAGTSMLGWALGLGGMLLAGGAVTTYFLMDGGDADDEHVIDAPPLSSRG